MYTFVYTYKLTVVVARYLFLQSTFLFQAPKSAPPARTQSLRAAHKPCPKDGFSISLDDIYQSAERERLSYSAACRRQNLEHAQSQTQFFRHESNALTLSRPNTSGSFILSRREIATPLSAWSEPQISRPSSLMRHSGIIEIYYFLSFETTR